MDLMEIKTKDFLQECTENALAVAILTKDGGLATMFGGYVNMFSGAILLDAIAQIEK